jgi:hypothetical protein
VGVRRADCAAARTAQIGMDEAITIGVNLAARGNPMLWSVDVLLQVVCHVRS